ncbi:MAG: FGGY family carbohydrate kinase [Actinomycetia bacterium]|nr:FGGY family carbohydrate kinase [Actinomycetes bacterium]
MSGAILAIDQGTSGTKAIVVAEDDTIASLVEAPIRPRYLSDGGVEQDPGELMDSVVETARRAVAEAGLPLAGVTLTNQGETVLAWDQSTGEPLSDLVVWQDSRAQSVCDELAEHADLVASRTGLVLDPYFTAPKMTWLRRNWTSEGVVTTSDSWILHRICGGGLVTDITTASRSLLKPQTSQDWDPELLALFGLADEPVPVIVANDAVIGETTWFQAPVPVAGAVVDQQAALLAESCLEPGDAKCTLGTGAFLLVNAGQQAQPSGSGLSQSTAWMVDQVQSYCYDGQVYTVASAVRWLEQLGLLGGAAQLDEVALPDAGGVTFVPALAGLGAPWWRSDARAALVGLNLASGPAQVVTAVLQGIAANVAVLAGMVEEDSGQRISRLRVDGGLTRSRYLMQAIADLVQVEVETYASPHATPLGAVALARKALSPGRSLADCVPAWEPAQRYQPSWSADRAGSFLAGWREAVDRAVR